eukprot:3309993-Prymnesium_polylepis.1
MIYVSSRLKWSDPNRQCGVRDSSPIVYSCTDYSAFWLVSRVTCAFACRLPSRVGTYVRLPHLLSCQHP